jgi:hypothetical protein
VEAAKLSYPSGSEVAPRQRSSQTIGPFSSKDRNVDRGGKVSGILLAIFEDCLMVFV